MTAPGFLVVVYQFGKVASTALVKTLNKCEGVDAYQSHFLGNDALQRMIPNATNPNTSPYFRQHVIGQLNNNVELTHKVHRAMNGCDDRRLIVLSLSREPLDWFRSCIQQDILGYKDDLLAYSLRNAQCSDVPSINRGLIEILNDIVSVLDRFGGAQNAIDKLEIGSNNAMVQDQEGLESDFLRRMFLLSLRPLVWFDEHFSRCFKVRLADFECRNEYWKKSVDGASFVVMRYEDLDRGFAKAMLDLKVPIQGDRLLRANVSKDKPHAAEVRMAFSDDVAGRLRGLLLRSNYATHFGYCASPEMCLM